MRPTARPDINERVQHGELPEGVEWQRTTDELTDLTVPAGLLRAHQIAPGVWGRLRVLAGTVVFVWEDGSGSVDLHEGDAMVIPPATLHHVEPGTGARFHLEFHR